MKAFLKSVFGFLLFLAVLAVLGRTFFFQLARTESYSMVPNLVAGDTFLVLTRGLLGPGEVAVCQDPENPDKMVVGRIIGVPGSTVAINANRIIVNGAMQNYPSSDILIYEDNTSGEQLEFSVSVVEELVGGHFYPVAFMERAGDRDLPTYTVGEGFFLLGDNRNRARDSRHFGEVPIESCLGKAFMVIWPGPDSGDLTKTSRILKWID